MRRLALLALIAALAGCGWPATAGHLWGPSQVNLVQPFGVLTAVGAGGVPVTGTSISSGDAAGYFQISGGFLTMTSTGRSAGLSACPCNLVFNDASTLKVTGDGNAYSVRTAAEFTAAVTAASSGQIIAGRAGISIASNMSVNGNLGRRDFGAGGLTIRSQDATRHMTFTDASTISGAKHVRFVNVDWGRLAGTRVELECSSTWPCDDITWRGGTIHGLYVDPTYDDPAYATGGIAAFGPGNGTGINNASAWSKNITVAGVHFDSLVVGVSLYADGAAEAVTDSIFDGMYLWAVHFTFMDDTNFSGHTPVNVPVTVTGNQVSRNVADPLDFNNPHSDSILFTFNNFVSNTDWTVTVKSNLLCACGGRGTGNIIALRGAKTTGYYIADVEDNTILNYTGTRSPATASYEGLTIATAKNSTVKNNIVVGRGLAGAPDGIVQISVGDPAAAAIYDVSGTLVMDHNVSERIGSGGTPTGTNVAIYGGAGYTYTMAQTFNGSTFTPSTIAAMVTALVRKSTGPAYP